MKLLYTSIFLILTTFAYCQKSTLFQNINFRAKELKHNLNKDGDSLILEGERTIYNVTIFNKDFEHSLSVNDSKVKISLHDIPVGRFVVEATLKDKLIVLTLLRNETLSPAEAISVPLKKTSLFGHSQSITATKAVTAEKKVEAPRLVVVDKNETENTKSLSVSSPRIATVKKDTSNINTTNITEDVALNKTLATNPGRKKKVQTYWIVFKTNKTYGAGTVKRFGDKDIVDRMISHINLDKRTIAGRRNELTVWEVYDVEKFIKHKMNKTNNLSEESDCFNSKPYFQVENDSTES